MSNENKGVDQLRGNREADLRLCFRICRMLVFPLSGSFGSCSDEKNIRKVLDFLHVNVQVHLQIN